MGKFLITSVSNMIDWDDMDAVTFLRRIEKIDRMIENKIADIWLLHTTAIIAHGADS